MLYGYSFSGKSTAAKRLKDYFSNNGISCEIIKSVSTRFSENKKVKFTRDSIDQYQCMVEQTDKLDDSELNELKIIKFVRRQSLQSFDYKDNQKPRENNKLSLYNCGKNNFVSEIINTLKSN